MSNNTDHTLGIVFVLDKEGEPIASTWVSSSMPRTWEVLTKHFKFVKGNKERYDAVLVPEENAAWKEGLYTPQMCLYEATSKYMRNLLGITMDFADERWFKQHPLTLQSGVEVWETLRVAQELIEPYGMRISAVRVKPGLNLHGDLIQWQRILGVNPIGLKTRGMNNEEFCQMSGLKPDEVAFNFEFHDQPLTPGVSCGLKTGQQGNEWGHAEYLSPREAVSSSIMSFRVDRKPNVHWYCEPKFTEPPKNDKSTKYISLPDFRLPNGKRVSDEAWAHLRQDNPRHPLALVAKTDHKLTRYALPGGVDTKGETTYRPSYNSNDIDGFRECHLCGDCRMTDDQMLTLHGKMCRECWAIYWQDYHCKSCDADLEQHTPMYGGYTIRNGEEVIVGICTECHKVTDLAASEDRFHMTPLVYASLIDNKGGDEVVDDTNKQKEKTEGRGRKKQRSESEQIRSVH